jgi:translation initiation factor 1
MCPECERPVGECVCVKTVPVVAGDGIVRVGRETKGRKGKGVTVITGLALERERLAKLATELRQSAGPGGR